MNKQQNEAFQMDLDRLVNALKKHTASSVDDKPADPTQPAKQAASGYTPLPSAKDDYFEKEHPVNMGRMGDASYQGGIYRDTSQPSGAHASAIPTLAQVQSPQAPPTARYPNVTAQTPSVPTARFPDATPQAPAVPPMGLPQQRNVNIGSQQVAVGGDGPAMLSPEEYRLRQEQALGYPGQ